MTVALATADVPETTALDAFFAVTAEQAALYESLEPPDWQLGALCAQTDPDAWFPEKGGSYADARRVCLVCDGRDACLAYALEHNEEFGMWGALTARERRRLAGLPDLPDLDDDTDD